MSVTIPSGQGITLKGSFTDAAGHPLTPTNGQLTVTDPTGAVSTYPWSSLASPSPGVFTKLLTPLAVGRWTYAFHATETVLSVATGAFSVAPEDWTPTVDEVGTLLRSRTIDGDGREAGTFTSSTRPVKEQTRPTSEQVARIIEEEVGALQGFIGYDLSPTLWQLAHEAALYRAGARVELTYFPEQVQSGHSSYDQLVANRDLEEGRLISAVRATSGAGEAGGRALGTILCRPHAASTSETVIATSNVIPDSDIPPFAPGWPVGGPAGTVI
jgi:hypothetical protein